MNKKFLVGSRYFFNNIEGFSSKDEDILELVLIPRDFRNMMQIHGKGHCCFRWRKMSPQEFIKITKQSKCPMTVGKFLVPEFNKEIGFTIDHLKQLRSLVDQLDEKHLYEKVIYEAYIANNDFYLTEEQLLNAYNEYKKYRE
jgi:hypothetical protein